MAVSISGAGTSMKPSSRRITIGSLSSDHVTKSIGKACLPGLKWRRRAAPFLAVRGQDRNSDLLIETRSTLEHLSRDVVSKDLSTLPRPLTTQFLKDGSRLRVAYKGVRGAYSESAAEKVYPNCEAVPCKEFDTAFDLRRAVEHWIVDRAVLAIESSLGGTIHRNYDLLLRHSLHIVGEVKLWVRLCLMANQGVEIEDLNRVFSHPQALVQCENSLTRLGLVREAVDDTAGAAKHVAFHNLKDGGVVATSKAAAIYGLNILARDIQDDCDNVTRFLILAREPINPGTRPFKVCSTESESTFLHIKSVLQTNSSYIRVQ